MKHRFAPHNTLAKDHWFKPGQSGNPLSGKPKGFLKTKTAAMQEMLRVIDEVLADQQGLDAFRAKLLEAWRNKPLDLWQKFIFPLLPRETNLSITRQIGSELAHLSVTQLKQIAAAAPEDPPAVRGELPAEASADQAEDIQHENEDTDEKH